MSQYEIIMIILVAIPVMGMVTGWIKRLVVYMTKRFADYIEDIISKRK